MNKRMTSWARDRQMCALCRAARVHHHTSLFTYCTHCTHQTSKWVPKLVFSLSVKQFLLSSSSSVVHGTNIQTHKVCKNPFPCTQTNTNRLFTTLSLTRDRFLLCFVTVFTTGAKLNYWPRYSPANWELFGRLLLHNAMYNLIVITSFR